MNKNLSAFLLFVVTTGSLYAQSSIDITDKDTGEAIEGVMVQVSYPSGKNEVLISDKKGQVIINAQPPYTIQLSHLNYHSFSKEVKESTSLSFVMTPKNIVLDNIVVTGQYQPQSASNSVYTVRTVSEEQIQGMGATQLTDVLAKQLNIRITPDNAIGSSTLKIQGIEGNNLKILVDGVPLVNRTGNGNDVDLSQINMANIERVEIVEGPMAVNYGANALAGVINLITKKVDKGNYRIGVDLQGESVDGAYSLNDGVTNVNLTSGFNLSDNFLLSVNGGTYRFGGYDTNYEVRGQLWNPKTQYFYDATLAYSKKNINISYKFDDFYEKIIDEDSVIQERYHAPTGSTRYFAIDEEYKSRRTSHQLQANGKLGESTRYTFMASYSDFERKKRSYEKYLDNSEENDLQAEGLTDTTSYSAIVSRGSVQSTNPNASINYQVGYEINLESTTGGRIKDDEKQSINDYAFFVTAEIIPFERFKVRPGIRGSFNSTYGSNLSPALNLKYFISPSFNLNAAYGRGYRAPSLRELYFEFIDSNHNIYGNEDLTPEYSNHYDIGATHKWSNNTIGLKSNITLFYNDITNRIDYEYDENNPLYARFINLAYLKTTGVNLSETFMWGHLTLGMGFGITGINNDYFFETPDKFLFSPDVSLDFSYLERKSKINISIFYKYNGLYPQYTQDSDTGEPYIAYTDPYNLLDITLNRKIIQYINVTIGVKNLLDVTNVQTTAGSGGTHSGSSEYVSKGYGISYFAKISFNLNSNK